MPPNEVFLSHSSLDRPFVTGLAELLRQHGVPVWYSQSNILGAQQWHDEIGAALKRCDFDQLSWALSVLQFVNLTQNIEDGGRDLLRIWGLGYKS